MAAREVSSTFHYGKGKGKGHHIRLNQLQVIGSHNSYHREVSLSEREVFPELIGESTPENYYYSHASVHDQLEYQQIRSFEFDVFADSKGGLFADPLIRRLANMSDAEREHYALPQDVMQRPGTKVLHVADADVGTTCHTLVECLTQVREWSDAQHRRHVPIPILLEFKMSNGPVEDKGGVRAEEWTTEVLDKVDKEIRSVFSPDRLITPDDIRRAAERASGRKHLTLEEAILMRGPRGAGGWPTLDDARGKVLFLMDNEPTHSVRVRDAYRAGGRDNLEGRVIFTNSEPGQPDAAFIKRNDPLGEKNQREIKQLVSKGYLVRTRADVPLDTILNGKTDMREAAFASGAHIVSTDWPAPGSAGRYNSDYVVKFPRSRAARCNPINAPKHCDDSALERL